MTKLTDVYANVPKNQLITRMCLWHNQY